ncbi:MAG: hypothetical protein DIU80_017430, partial [Chloroflexota bacterium]
PEAPPPAPTAPPARSGGGTGGGTGTGGARATSAPTSTPEPTATEAPTTADGLFFRMASDWGSAFPGQEISYVIAVRNTRQSGELRDVVVSSVLPANLTIISRSSDRGDPQQSGNRITLTVPSLAAGEGVEILVKTRVNTDVAVGTRVVAQAELSFAGLSIPAYSNIVTVLVVGPAQAAQGPATDTPTPLPATAVVTATAAISATTVVTPTTTQAAEIGAMPTAEVSTSTPEAVPEAVDPATNISEPAGRAAAIPAPLPNTSAGVPPLVGIMMLGMTLGLRTWRLHRAKERL